MPLYYCSVPRGSTSLEQRERIAAEITRIHCATTGAPPLFVHAFFVEASERELPPGKRAAVLGSIRAGRSPEQKRRIVSEIRGAIASITANAEDAVQVATVDVPARWVMEGGEVLPEPGDETAWLAQHA